MSPKRFRSFFRFHHFLLFFSPPFVFAFMLYTDMYIILNLNTIKFVPIPNYLHTCETHVRNVPQVQKIASLHRDVHKEGAQNRPKVTSTPTFYAISSNECYIVQEISPHYQTFHIHDDMYVGTYQICRNVPDF